MYTISSPDLHGIWNSLEYDPPILPFNALHYYNIKYTVIVFKFNFLNNFLNWLNTIEYVSSACFFDVWKLYKSIISNSFVLNNPHLALASFLYFVPIWNNNNGVERYDIFWLPTNSVNNSSCVGVKHKLLFYKYKKNTCNKNNSFGKSVNLFDNFNKFDDIIVGKWYSCPPISFISFVIKLLIEFNNITPSGVNV